MSDPWEDEGLGAGEPGADGDDDESAGIEIEGGLDDPEELEDDDWDEGQEEE